MLICCTLLWNLGAWGLLGSFVVVFFTSMVFYLIKNIDLLNGLSFYSWGARS